MQRSLLVTITTNFIQIIVNRKSAIKRRGISYRTFLFMDKIGERQSDRTKSKRNFKK